MADFQPAPTYADPVLIDPASGKAKFNPLWLDWFLRLVQYLNASGGTTAQHNSLAGLQGGTAGQYYHLTSTQHSKIADPQAANTFFAGPASGAAAIPAFRALVTADLPAGTGTVTSVAASVSPTTNVSVSGSPITSSGTFAFTITPWWFQRNSVGAAETLTIPAGYQCLFADQLTAEGNITNEGDLVVI